jgi:very-short-patch-repair endonuclease
MCKPRRVLHSSAIEGRTDAAGSETRRMQQSIRAIVRYIRQHGGALSLPQLDAAGMRREDVAAAAAAEVITRIRRGWFAVPDAHRDVVRAVRVGGAATGASVARMHGLWMHDDQLLHVRVPRTASRLRSPEAASGGVRLDRQRHAVCVHYRSAPPIRSARDPLPLALAEMLVCATPEAVIAAIDSALARRALSLAGLAELRELALPSRRTILDGVSEGSESGIETRVRLFLRAHTIRHRAQVHIGAVGRVDLLVGDRLVIEVDGSEYHTGIEFESDRRRDFLLAMRGYLVIRLSYRMVMDHWDATSRGILVLIARGEHRWGYRAAESEGAGVELPRVELGDDTGWAPVRDGGSASAG